MTHAQATPTCDGLTVSGGTGTPSDPYVLEDRSDLPAFHDLAYALATTRSTTNACWSASFEIREGTPGIDLTGFPWIPSGLPDTTNTPDQDDHAAFSGTFDANGVAVTNMTIDLEGEGLFVGFFREIDSGTIEDLVLHDVQITIDSSIFAATGDVAGAANHSLIRNVSVSASIHDPSRLGGIAGQTLASDVRDVHIENLELHGTSNLGDAIGYADETRIIDVTASGSIEATHSHAGSIAAGISNETVIENAASTVTMSATDYLGGIVGDTDAGTLLNNARATGTFVKGKQYVGGVAGSFHNGMMERSFATTAVTGVDQVGGRVGPSFETGTAASFATGRVIGAYRVGGLAGYVFRGAVSDTVAPGSVTTAGFHESG